MMSTHLFGQAADDRRHPHRQDVEGRGDETRPADVGAGVVRREGLRSDVRGRGRARRRRHQGGALPPLQGQGPAVPREGTTEGCARDLGRSPWADSERSGPGVQRADRRGGDAIQGSPGGSS